MWHQVSQKFVTEILALSIVTPQKLSVIVQGQQKCFYTESTACVVLSPSDLFPEPKDSLSVSSCEHHLRSSISSKILKFLKLNH